MRWFTLAFLALTGCDPEPVCDADKLEVGVVKAADLSPAEGVKATAAAMLGACNAEEVDPGLVAWVTAVSTGAARPAEAEALWASACPDLPLSQADGAPHHAQRTAAFAACPLEGVHAPLAVGDPFLGLVVSRWLVSAEVELKEGLAAQLVKQLAGDVPDPGLDPASLPRLDSVGPAVPADVTVAKDGTVTGDATSVTGIAAHPDVPMTAVIDVLRTGAQPGGTVRFLGFSHVDGKPDRFGATQVQLTGKDWMPGDVGVIARKGTLGDFLSANDGLPLYVPFHHAACAEAPAGMACIAGGPASVGGFGDDDPERAVDLSTFYVDTTEVSLDDWRACVKGGVCAPTRRAAGDAVIVPADRPGKNRTPGPYLAAVKYCAWAGKRLPTEWEWQKASSQFQGADNGWEWTGTWAHRGLDSCGDDCGGRDPEGPCQGVFPCANHGKLILRNGDKRDAQAETPRVPTTLRCATSHPWLTNAPAKVLTEPLPEVKVPEPPTAEQLAIAHGIKDDAIEDKPFCEDRRGRSRVDCKDPNSYLKPNEGRAHVFRRYIRNIGGAYVGVASDQNYSYAAIAHTEWLFLMDYDPNVVRLHKALRPLILKAEDPDAFVKLFDADNEASSVALIEAEWADNPDKKRILGIYTRFRQSLGEHYRKGMRTGTQDDGYGWLRNPEHYAWIRMLHQQKRIVVVGGDMLADGALRNIGRACQKMGVPMRIYFTSNAPDAWGGAMTPDYKANVLALPMDEHSVILQVLGFGTGYGQTGYWHNNVYNGLLYQKRLAKPSMDFHWKLVTDRIPTDDPDVTTNGLRGR